MWPNVAPRPEFDSYVLQQLKKQTYMSSFEQEPSEKKIIALLLSMDLDLLGLDSERYLAVVKQRE